VLTARFRLRGLWLAALAAGSERLRAEDSGATLESFELLRVVPLKGDTYHVQGVDRVGDRVYVTSVERAARKGYLFEFSYPGGDLLRSVEVQEGDRYHPGGLSIRGDSIWIPVSEYRPKSSTVIQRRNLKTFAIESKFVVEDSIGCLAAGADVLAGGNWDSREIYLWDYAGKQRDRIANPNANAYQDLKFASGMLVGGGLLPGREGAIDWMEFPSLRLARRMKAGRTDRHVPYTQEGMAIAGQELLLLPEDAPSRLFVFRLGTAPLRLIAHRGGVVSERSAENSPAAIEEAIRRGYWMVEVDVRESKDGRLVVNHDQSFRRYYGVDRLVEEMTWDEIERLRATPGGTRPMTFRELCALARGRIRLMVEAKGNKHSEAYYRELESALRDNRLLESAYFLCPPGIPERFRGESRLSSNARRLREMAAQGDPVERLYFLFERGNMKEEAVRWAQARGIPVVPAINTFHYEGEHAMAQAASDIQRLLRLGVTDFQIDSSYETAFPRR
jgi:glycerophosphoryl diester phosphodiesterase